MNVTKYVDLVKALVQHYNSVIELAEKSCCTANPMGWRCIDLLTARNLDIEDVIRGGSSSGEDTSSEASLVHRARILCFIGYVVLCRLEMNHGHLVVQFILINKLIS